MTENTVARPRRGAGFTLVELMAVVLIAAILLSIAIPLYLQQIRHGRRTDAKTAVMDLAGREERQFSTANAYSSDPTVLGYAAVGSGAAFPQTVGSGYFNINVTIPVPPNPPISYTITSTAITADQLKDTSCFSFSVTQTGAQSSLSSTGTTTTSTCWQ